MSGNLVPLGDFNFKDINWDSLDGTAPLSVKFCDIIFDLNLTQLINQSTYIAGNTLDLVLISSPDSIFNLHVHDNPPLPIPSDHYIITFDVFASPVSGKTKSQIHFLNFSKGDYEGHCHFLSTVDFSHCFQSEDVEFIWSYLNALIKDAINKFVPTSPISNLSGSILIFDIILNVWEHLGTNLTNVLLKTIRRSMKTSQTSSKQKLTQQKLTTNPI